MAKSSTKTYARMTLEALSLLADAIKTARREKGIRAQELAERAGISRGLLQRIERGDPGCSIGAVFEVATILGIPLFHPDPETRALHHQQLQQWLTLLPKDVRKKRIQVDDRF